MKLNLKNIAILLVSVLAIGFTLSCSDDDDDANSLVGTTWYDAGCVYTINTGNPVYDQIIKEEEDQEGEESIYLIFKEDGVYTMYMRERGYPKDFPYTQNGNKLTVNGYTATIDGDFIYSIEEDDTERIQRYIANGFYPGVPTDTQVISASYIEIYKKGANK